MRLKTYSRNSGQWSGMFTENKTEVSEFYTDCLVISTSVRITFMEPFFQVSFGQSFWFAWSTAHICLWSQDPIFDPDLRILPHVHTQSHLGSLALVNITSPLSFKEPFCACVVGEVSWLPQWEICGLGRAQPPLSIILLFSSWSVGPQGMNL